MDIGEVAAQLRQERGTRACGRLRRQGFVPGVLYGGGGPPVNLSLDLEQIEGLIQAHTFIIRVTWDGQSENVQIKAAQFDALGDHIIHVDLTRISLTEMITVSVPVLMHGEPAAVADGGVLEQLLHEIQVDCLPTAVPEQIRVEVGELALHERLTLGDIVFPDGVRPTADPETPVVVVASATEEVEEEEALEALEAAAPEVIGREAEQEEEQQEGR